MFRHVLGLDILISGRAEFCVGVVYLCGVVARGLDFGCLFEIVLLGLAWDSGCWLCVGVLSLWVWIWLFDLVTWCGLGLGVCFGVWFGGCFGVWIPLYLGSYGFGVWLWVVV